MDEPGGHYTNEIYKRTNTLWYDLHENNLRDELREAESRIAKGRMKRDDMSKRRQSFNKWDEQVLDICGHAQCSGVAPCL